MSDLSKDLSLRESLRHLPDDRSEECKLFFERAAIFLIRSWGGETELQFSFNGGLDVGGDGFI